MTSVNSTPEDAPKVTSPVPQDRIEEIINTALGTSAKIVDMPCDIIAEGKGFLSVITRAKLTWSASDADLQKLPKAIIMKKPTMDKIKDLNIFSEFFKDIQTLKVLHNRECDAYEFFNRHKPTPFPMARCFICEKMTDDPKSGLIILEDLSDVGKSLHFNEDASIEKIMTVVGHVASLQAYGFEHPEYRDSIGSMPFDMGEVLFEHILTHAKSIREKYPDRFKFTDERIMEMLDDCKKDMDIIMAPEKHGYTPVIALGDVQPNNVLWKMNDDGTLTDEVAAFLDFQAAHTGICCMDMGMLAFMNMCLKDWKDNEDAVLDHYFSTLRSKTTKDITITRDEMKRLCAMQKKSFGLGSLTMVDALGGLGEKAGITKERIDELLDRALDGFDDSINVS